MFAVAGFLSACVFNTNTKKIPRLTETYSYVDKNPFGAYIAYHQLTEMFYRNSMRNEKRSFEKAAIYQDDTSSVYICIAHSLFTTDDDVSAIISFAERGNDIFLSCAEFDDNLLKRLNCEVTDVYINKLHPDIYETTGLRINTGISQDSGFYRYFYFPFTSKFSSYNKTNTHVLGVNENGDADFIVISKGSGHIFLHLDPRAFSNYFLLQKNNYQYMEKAFGFLNAYPDHVYWNNYYLKFRSKQSRLDDNDDFNSFSEILSHPPLAAAFWLAIILLLLYILFGMKRRQRIVEMIKPNENTTVTFTETIGRLYLQKKDNKNIAGKMITYFNEYIRNNYFLNTNIINDDFITTLSRKSAVPRDKVESLYRAMDHALQHPTVDDYQLLSLNEQMQDFFKRII